MAAAAHGEAGLRLRISGASCDDDCASFARLCLDKAGTVGGLVDMERWRKAREKEKTVKVRSLTALEKRRKEKVEKARRDAHLKKLRERRGDGLADEAAAVAEHDGVWADLEPLFLDEAVAEHERRMQREEDNRKLCIAREAALDRIREYDPKTGTTYYSRVEHVGDILKFDHDEESPLGPMRYTEALIYAHGSVQGDSANMLASDSEKKLIASDTANMLASVGEKKLVASYSANLGPIEKITFSLKGDSRRFLPEDSANVFSIKIVSSDVGFPIDVYGTVIARDNIDRKSVYLFRRDRDHSQLILTKDESLILTGPKRGLALGSYIYVEFDLKIKFAGRQKDKQLSKGYMTLNALKYRWFEEMEVESETLDTKLSKVMITYAVVHTAVEATFVIEVLRGRFYGEITACTTGIRDSIVLHDSKMVEAMPNSGKGVIQLLRNVVAVDMRKKLILSIVARSDDGKPKSTTIRLTPGLIGGQEKEITCGSIKMCVKVRWSIISRRF